MPALTATFDDTSSQTGGIVASSATPSRGGRLTALVFGLLSASAWLAQAAITNYLPDQGDFGRAHEFAIASAAFAAAITAASLAGLWYEGLARKVRHSAPWLFAGHLPGRVGGVYVKIGHPAAAVLPAAARVA